VEVTKNRPGAAKSPQASGERLVVTTGVIAVVVVIAVFLLIRFLSGRPLKGVDGKDALGGPQSWKSSACRWTAQAVFR